MLEALSVDPHDPVEDLYFGVGAANAQPAFYLDFKTCFNSFVIQIQSVIGGEKREAVAMHYHLDAVFTMIERHGFAKPMVKPIFSRAPL